MTILLPREGRLSDKREDRSGSTRAILLSAMS